MYGLVLEGGGAKGSYQIGACKAMQELGITIGGVAGTSVGALNGAMIVQGDLDRACEIWCDINPAKVLGFTDEEISEFGKGAFHSDDLGIRLSRIKKIVIERGLDITPLIKTISEVMDENRIRSSPMDFGIVTVDLTDRKPVEIFKEDIPKGKLVDYLIASASFPGFKLKEIDGKVFIDGGIYNALPINLVEEKGYKDIIVVRTFGIGRKKKFDTTGLNITYISPSESLGAVLDFGNEKANKNIKMGYYDAIRVFKGLKGRKYYIKPLHDNYFIKYFTRLSDDKIKKLSELFGIGSYSGKRILFEYIIPKTADLLGMSLNASYEDIAVALIETIAEDYGVERFKVYSLKELILELARLHKPAKDDFIKEIPGFLRKVDLISKMVRNEILSNVAQILFENMKEGKEVLNKL